MNERVPPTSTDQLAERTYRELRRLAAYHLAREKGSPTLQPTDLVNEAYIRLRAARCTWANETHFKAVASMQIRRLLLSYARRRRAQKRAFERVTIDPDLTVAASDTFDIVALSEALERLDALSPRQVQVVVLRYFGGLKTQEIASYLKIAERTVRNDWEFARVWLKRELRTARSPR